MNRLRELREDKDLLQKDIANMLNKPRKTYGNYETFICEIPINDLKQLSKFYNVSIDYILYRTDNRKAYSNTANTNTHRLKELRIKYNKSQKDISYELNLPLKTYIKYEHGERSLNIVILNTFADYYKTSIDYIVYNTDEIKPHKKSIVDWKEK